MLDLRCSAKFKKLRWTCYMDKQKTIDKWCTELLGDHGPTKTIICFGDANFSHTFGGSRSSPKQGPFVKVLKQKNAHVFMTPEFNTSQVCSNCLAPTRLKPGCKSRKVIETHFVRSCTTKTCLTVWNRDINAARNMIKVGRGIILCGGKPEVFSHVLPKLQDPKPIATTSTSASNSDPNPNPNPNPNPQNIAQPESSGSANSTDSTIPVDSANPAIGADNCMKREASCSSHRMHSKRSKPS